MKRISSLGIVSMTAVLLFALSACQDNEGPAEKAGKSMDEATEAVGKKIEDAGEAMQDAAEGDAS
jgi:predicted small secreted protein